MTLLGRAILNQPLTLKPLTDSEYFTSMPKDYQASLNATGTHAARNV